MGLGGSSAELVDALVRVQDDDLGRRDRAEDVELRVGAVVGLVEHHAVVCTEGLVLQVRLELHALEVAVVGNFF